MKKIKMLSAGLFMIALSLTSCGSEESVATNKANTVEFAKTDVMLNFEYSLKNWFQAKRENSGNESLKSAENQITKEAKTLLTALGKSEIAEKKSQSTDELVRAAMKAYSEKLTEMYRTQQNPQ